MATTEWLEEVKATFISGDDNVQRYRIMYLGVYDKPTTLTDDQIIEMVADSEDDNDADGWAATMRNIETSLTPAA